jgi:hypothetical protein
MTFRVLLLRQIYYCLLLKCLLRKFYSIPISETQMSVTDIDNTVTRRAIRDILPTPVATRPLKPLPGNTSVVVILYAWNLDVSLEFLFFTTLYSIRIDDFQEWDGLFTRVRFVLYCKSSFWSCSPLHGKVKRVTQ